MGAGGIIQQRAEVKAAIGPDTANFSFLSEEQQDQVRVICEKGFDHWTNDETAFAASMIPVAITNAASAADDEGNDDEDDDED